MTTTVHLLRHGTVHNPDEVLYGRLPGFRLSDHGMQQAQTVADHLAGHDVAAVVASPLLRAQQTAEPIAKAHGLTVETDDGLIEADNVFEGKKVSVGDGVLRNPKHWPKIWNPFRPSWGEPYVELAKRMEAAVHRARKLGVGREVVCVSHQLPIWTVRRHLEGKRLWHDPRKRECGLASLTSLVYDDDTLVEIRYSEPAGRSDPRVTGA